jgi:polysaccharide export outer membrane protein
MPPCQHLFKFGEGVGPKASSQAFRLLAVQDSSFGHQGERSRPSSARPNSSSRVRQIKAWLLILACLLSTGCHNFGLHKEKTTPLPPMDAPRELAKVVLPDYIIEPPDVLQIEVSRITPREVHRIGPMDVLLIQSTATLPDQPISGPYVVGSDGAVNFGASYGSVPVAGLTAQEAQLAIAKHLGQILKMPSVSVSTVQSSGKQSISGEFLVGPDGTVSFGTYGRVLVTGRTVEEARRQIEMSLNRFMVNPEVSVDVVGFNSKTYYIITEGAGFGDGVNRFPVTGSETVLDAIAQINGLSQVSSKKIWISRPAPAQVGCDQILPVDWVSITKGGSTQTNYQIMPGDRIFVAQDHLVAVDTALGKLLSPMERIFGFTLLGSTTVQTINRFPKGYLTPPGVGVF